MLQIREEQRNVLREAVLAGFEDRMLAHFKTYYGVQCQLIGDEQTRAVIRHGTERAREYAITSQRGVCHFINLMLLLGGNFDQDVQLPWARRILTDPSIENEFDRMASLNDEADVFLDAVLGVDGEYAIQAMINVYSESLDSLILPLTGDRSEDVNAFLWKLYPRKVEVLGSGIIDELVVAGTDAASRYDIRQARNVIGYIGFMFMLGGGFDMDPRLPKAHEILTDPDLADETARIDALYENAKEEMRRGFKLGVGGGS